jgi:hypothetical protein
MQYSSQNSTWDIADLIAKTEVSIATTETLWGKMKMNLIQIAMASACVVLVSLAGFTRTNHGWLTSAADQWFDSYGNLSGEDEKAHLDNLAIALQHDPNLVGYIIVYAGKRSCANEAADRALRAKKYVVEIRGIQESRIQWIDGGYREELTVILQPVPSGAPELTASPTLKPSEVRIIRNCKPKTSKPKKHGS